MTQSVGRAVGEALPVEHQRAPWFLHAAVRTVDRVLQALHHPDAVLTLGAWAYVVLAFAVLADSVVPLIPSELLCVAAGAFAATGRLNPWLVVPAVVAGGVLGDQATYHLGRAGSGRAVRTLTATPRRRRLFERLHRARRAGARRRSSSPASCPAGGPASACSPA